MPNAADQLHAAGRRGRLLPGVRPVGTGHPGRLRGGTGHGPDRAGRRAARRRGGPGRRAVRRPGRAGARRGARRRRHRPRRRLRHERRQALQVGSPRASAGSTSARTGPRSSPASAGSRPSWPHCRPTRRDRRPRRHRRPGAVRPGVPGRRRARQASSSSTVARPSATIHPSAVLRAEAEERAEAYAGLVADLAPGRDRIVADAVTRSGPGRLLRLVVPGLAGRRVPAGRAGADLVRAVRRALRHRRDQQHLLPAADAERPSTAGRPQAPPGFCYAVKVGQFGSHRMKLRDPAAGCPATSSGSGGSAQHLGPNLVQLPPRWRRDVGRLDDFLGRRPDDVRWAVELRDPRWLARRRLRRARPPRRRPVHPRPAGGPSVGAHDRLDLRPVPRAGRPVGGPTTAATGRLAWRRSPTARPWLAEGTDVYAYFNNDYEGHAVADAETLRRCLGATPPRSISVSRPLVRSPSTRPCRSLPGRRRSGGGRRG